MYTSKSDKAIEKILKKRVKFDDFKESNYGLWRGKPTASPIQRKKARDLDEEDDALLEAAEKEFREAREKQKESSAQKTAETKEPEKNDANEELISD